MDAGIITIPSPAFWIISVDSGSSNKSLSKGEGRQIKVKQAREYLIHVYSRVIIMILCKLDKSTNASRPSEYQLDMYNIW